MYSMVLMAALTTGVDLPDRGGCRGGCYGGCYGGRRHGCHGCCGGCYGCYGGCYGCYGGCYGCYGGCYGCYGGGGVIMQHGGAGSAPEKIQTKPKAKQEESLAPAPATILVDLPAEAKLRIDNEATTSTGGSRLFQTPALNPGKEYHYTLTAEVVRDGKPIKAEKVVTVKAGQITPVTLTLPRPGVAQR
jgi:uncharacterized protein (TIGR03000 family)